MTRKQAVSVPTRMLREVRKAEAAAREAGAPNPGTGFTILKLQRHQPPLATLVNANRIGAVELQAADEIALAVKSVATGGILRVINLEKIDHGKQGDDPWPHEIAIAVRNYQGWQKHWTKERNLTGNPMLECIWSAVIDQRPISVIAQEIGYSRHNTRRAIIAGLRHYAAWAKMVTGTQRAIWLGEAQHVFDKRLSLATS